MPPQEHADRFLPGLLSVVPCQISPIWESFPLDSTSCGTVRRLYHTQWSGRLYMAFHSIVCFSLIPFQLPCGFLPWHHLLHMSNPFCFLDWSSWNHSWGEPDWIVPCSVSWNDPDCQGGETVQPIERTPGVLPHQVQWPWFCPRPFFHPELLLSAGFLSHNIWRLLNHQVNMILSLYLSLTGLLGNRETIVCSYIANFTNPLYFWTWKAGGALWQWDLDGHCKH